MRLQDLNWMDVERYLTSDNRIIIITGSTEQHAYLSLTTDTLIPTRIALAVAERESVIIAPPLPFGVSPLFVDFPGTISLSRATFDALLIEVVESLIHQGFTHFFMLNGHGGNQMPERLRDLHSDGTASFVWYDWWREKAVKAFEARHQLKLDHANWGENFPFNRVSPSPRTEKTPVNLELLAEHSPREVLGDGNFGGLYQVDDALTQELFLVVVDEVTELVRGLAS
ncbi:MAG: creatininase family protein [Chloroflexota bacterium]|nr:creatininase family protein [Chloroflexota bacterium]